MTPTCISPRARLAVAAEAIDSGGGSARPPRAAEPASLPLTARFPRELKQSPMDRMSIAERLREGHHIRNLAPAPTRILPRT